ncbi:Epididymal sperm-binding protein 1, partial [Ophiophagus hannah]
MVLCRRVFREKMASVTAFLLFCTLFQLLIATETPPCVFPFSYGGKSYYSCTEVDSPNHPWCATTANYDISFQWKYCATKDTHPCVFPFIYHGKSYNSCTEVDSPNHPWCATTANYDKSPQWKYCATK